MKINEIIQEGKTGPGLWANIHAKQERIKSGSGEKMRKPGSKGAPTAKNFKDAANEGVAEGLGGQKPTITYNDYTLQYDYQTEDDDPEGYSTATTYYFDVFKDGKRVGEAEYFDYFGDLTIRINGKTKKFEHQHPLASQVSKLVSSLPDEQKRDLSDPKFESQGVAEGKLKCSCHPGDADPDCPVHGLEPMEVGDALDESIIEETYDGDEFYEAYGDLWYDEEQLNEAEYQGRKVQLGKPMRGDVKKFKVYVKDPSTGNIKKVNFGDKNMRIRKSNPKARKSFRARHNCDNPGPRTKAKYWSCRKW